MSKDCDDVHMRKARIIALLTSGIATGICGSVYFQDFNVLMGVCTLCGIVIFLISLRILLKDFRESE